MTETYIPEDSSPERTVLARNVMLDREMIRALGCIIDSVHMWVGGGNPSRTSDDYADFLIAFHSKFSDAVKDAKYVRNASQEPQACGTYLVWGGEDGDSKWMRSPRIASWVRGRGWSADARPKFWQELPEGPVLNPGLKPYLERREGGCFKDWLGTKQCQQPNLALSVMLDQETVDAVKLIDGFAMGPACGMAIMDKGQSWRIDVFLERFKSKFRWIVQNSDPVVLGWESTPDVPGSYLAWQSSQGARFIKQWQEGEKWDPGQVQLWMRTTGYPCLRQSLSKPMNICPELDNYSDFEFLAQIARL